MADSQAEWVVCLVSEWLFSFLFLVWSELELRILIIQLISLQRCDKAVEVRKILKVLELKFIILSLTQIYMHFIKFVLHLLMSLT